MISSPLYDCSLHTTKKSTGLQIITDTLNEVQKKVNESSSNFIFKIVEKPEALGSEREKDIESIIQNMTQDQNDDQDGEENNEEGMNVDFDGDESN